MTVQTYKEACRIHPLGLAGLALVREIATTRGATKVNEVLVDSFTASAIVVVYDALNNENKEKLIKLPVGRVAEIAFKLIK